MKNRIAIIEDDAHFASHLKEYFSIKGLSIVAHELNYSKFLNIPGIQEKEIDLIIIDVNLAEGENGIDGIAKIIEKLGKVDFIILTSYDESQYIFKALCNGAVGYLTKGTSLEEIYQSIHDVLNGGSVMTPSIARKVVNYFSTNKSVEKNDLDVLTPREYEIVEGIKDGLSYKLIADRCFISIQTVRFHVKNIYKKLHVNSKAEVINLYFKNQ